MRNHDHPNDHPNDHHGAHLDKVSKEDFLAESDDTVWSLLGEGRQPKIDPRFTGQMRQIIAAEPPPRSGWRMILGWFGPVRIGAVATLALLLGWLTLQPLGPRPNSDLAPAVLVEESVLPRPAVIDPATDEATLLVALLPALFEWEEESEWVGALDTL